MQRPFPGVVLTFVGVVALGTVWAGQGAAVSFPQGVASGDVTPWMAVLWTRTDQPAELVVEVARDSSFQDIVLEQAASAGEATDFTVKVMVGPLEPGRLYFYRFRQGSSVSDTGRFRTAPLPHESRNVRFVISGDSDGTRVNGVPPYNNFEVFDQAREEEPDFFIYLGDTIYADSAFGPKATTLEAFRAKYKENRGYNALRALMASTSTYAMWDDHEVENDWDGETVDPMLMAAGLQAFQEYMPLREPSGWPHRLFRIFRWGKEVELIILDERQFRSADAEPSCLLASGIPDPAPTLPPLIRLLVGLPPFPPPGCVEVLHDPTRTMLGALQKAFLKVALLLSSATFKFIINEVPIIELFGLPYDRWEGYRAERDELLEFIRDHRVKNVVFLTTDIHANLVADVRRDTFKDRDSVAKEVIVGPIAQVTLQQELERMLGSDADTVVALLTLLIRPDCIELDTFAYGLVEVDATRKTATITLKDDGGEPFCRVTLFGRR